MTQEKTQTTAVKPVITMRDICARFSISPRQCRILIRRGIIQAKPLAYRKRPNRPERRPVDFFVSRAEFRRLEQYGLVYSDESEVAG